MHQTSFTIHPIAKISTPYRQKFGIPRQPGLVREASGWIEFLAPFDQPDLLAGLEDFSHIWLTFMFHACINRGWRPRVRPPRLGGNQRRGVLATRSPFRPNHLGLSVVELLEVQIGPKARLHVRGADLLDGTPIVDIKPFLPYADNRPEARAGFAEDKPVANLGVVFSPRAIEQLAGRATLRRLIHETIALDPRPAYHAVRQTPGRYAMFLYDLNVEFEICSNRALVTSVAHCSSSVEEQA